MKGKNVFTSTEIESIKKLIIEKLKATPTKQKGIRDKIRKIGFYYTDFDASKGNYDVNFIEELLQSGKIRIKVNGEKVILKTKLLLKKEVIDPEIPLPPKEKINLSFKNTDELNSYGFIGFKKIEDMFLDSSKLPSGKGIYIILKPLSKPGEYVVQGTGGYFKEKDPNVSIDILKENWVDNTVVVYIGKATSLKSRLRQYFGFGQGKNIGHYGGRLIWQLAYSKELVVCWKALPIEDPREAEASLIQQFVSKYGKRPFANLKD